MSYTSDAADQLVHLSIDGIERTCRITGRSAHNIVWLMSLALKNQEASRGLTDLKYLLQSGTELKIYSLSEEDLDRFSSLAASRNLLYCTLHRREGSDEPWDIIFPEKDDGVVCRIFRSLGITPLTQSGELEEPIEEAEEPVSEPANPTKAPPSRASQSVPTSQLYKAGETPDAAGKTGESVHEALDRLSQEPRKVPSFQERIRILERLANEEQEKNKHGYGRSKH